MIKHIQAPNDYDDLPENWKSIFLAGSIEMGRAELWQQKVVDYLIKYQHSLCDIAVYNPRRNDWDENWIQSKSNVMFTRQVLWEHKYLCKSDINFFYFDPNTKAPITLMEFGIAVAEPDKMIMVCPKGFWRKGNIDVMCDFYNIEVHEDLDSGLSKLYNIIG